MRGLILLLLGLAWIPNFLQGATSPPWLKKAYRASVNLAKKGKTEKAIALLGKILDRRDDHVSALIARPKQPFLDWLNAFDEEGPYTLETVREEPSVYVVRGFEDDSEKDKILQGCFRDVFEEELDGWCTDESQWPANRALMTFLEWFEVEWHSNVVDLT